MSITLKKNENDDVCTGLFVENNFKPINEIERSIIKKYRKTLWTPFMRGICDYDMIQKNDKIAVCISGGKDSLLLAKCMQQLQKYSNIPFEIELVAMNPGFNQINYDILTNSCKNIGIDVKIFDTQIFEIVDKIANNFPCYMCARMRRGALYEYAKQLGCNKIALGHHFDDFIETTMLNVLYAGNFKSMMPKLKATNYEDMELIRPLINVRENDIIKYTKDNGIQVMNCGCVVAAKKTSSKRSEIKHLLKQLREQNDLIDKSIFASVKNVNVDSIIGWQIDGENKTFLDEY
ncbi:MAG: tRNA 2-thiocytidine biosynthesis TtcA family protein [Mycoplasmatales bacterium]